MAYNIVELKDIFKNFTIGQQEVHVLKGITFNIESGDFIIIFGPSGCGKSTLLHIILGLEGPTTGSMKFLGVDLYDNRVEDFRSEFRKKHIGMVYQQSNWIKSLKVIENVAFPLLLLGASKENALKRADEMLTTVGMAGWGQYLATELSSGQQQKIALARALVTDPETIVADEPTGNLDYDSGQELMALLQKLNSTKNKTIIMVTHDLEYLTFAKSAVRIFNGQVVGHYGEADKDALLKTLKTKRGGELG
jgi:putative ABC transport system ATP-binding protein